MAGTTDARELILGEARVQFAAKGYDGTSVDAIVRAAGVSKGAFYWHFDSKFSLFRMLLEEEIRQVREFFLISEEELARPLETLMRKGEAYLERMSADRQSHLLWLELCAGGHRGREEMIFLARELFEMVRREIMPLLERAFPSLGKRSGIPRSEDLALLVETFFDGMVANLSLRTDLETSKALWRLAMKRIIEGGPSYAS